MKLNYTLALTTFLAASAHASASGECKVAINNLVDSFDIYIDLTGATTSAAQNAATMNALSSSLSGFSKNLVEKCTDVSNDVKTNQVLKLDYLKALETLKDVYSDTWSEANSINTDADVKAAAQSVLGNLDSVVDFIYSWPGTLKDNDFKRLVNDVLRLRVNTKAAIA